MKPKRFKFKYCFNLYSIRITVTYYSKDRVLSVIVATGIVDGKKQVWFLNKGMEVVKFIKQCVSDEEVFDWLEESIQKEVTND